MIDSLRRFLAGYPAWLAARYLSVVLGTALLALLGAALAATLPLRTELSWLLPDHQPSVVDLHKLTARRPAGTVFTVAVAAPEPEAARRFAADLTGALRRLPPALLREVDDDDGPTRRFIWEHRHLYASLADLEQVRDALQQRIEEEQRKSNPLLVDLMDEPPQQPEGPGWRALQGRLEEARAQAHRAPGYAAEGGRLRILVLRCPFGDTEPEKAQEALRAVQGVVASLRPASYHPQLEVGYTGDPVNSALEHDLILRDIATSTVLCLVLVMAVLLLWLRAPRAVLALCLSLGAGCALTFGVTRLWVGHLNSSTAFLGSVVAGNGINFGIILVARYLEERRHGAAHEAALRLALGQTALPTLVAAAAAGTAYLSLIITDFRGFSEFGIIAGSGMVLCWCISFSFLPALLTLLDRRRPLARALPHRTEEAVERMEPQISGRTRFALLIVLGTTAVSIYGGMRLSRDPFEDDLRTLRSRSVVHSAPGRWSRRIDEAFGKDRGVGLYLGVADAAQVPQVLKAIAAVDAPDPKQRLIGRIDALPNVLPGSEAEQRQKIEVLREVRRLVLKIEPHLDAQGEDARLLKELIPPPAEALRPITFADLPEALRRAFTENDGSVGKLMALHGGPAYVSYSYESNRRSVALLRSMALPQEVARTIQMSGQDMIFVDMMAAVQRDGPRATVLSLVLVLALLLLTFGLGRDLGITTYALIVAIFGMLGLMALLSVRLNFLNFIALPITIGIGVDYPLNVMVRLRQELTGRGQVLRGLLQTGGAVVLCSLTTMIGYAVLLLSDTGAIRSFGMAAVLGEITSILAAVVTVPCLLVVLHRLQRR